MKKLRRSAVFTNQIQLWWQRPGFRREVAAADTDGQGSALLEDKEPFPLLTWRRRGWQTGSPVKQALCSHDSREEVLSPRIREP